MKQRGFPIGIGFGPRGVSIGVGFMVGLSVRRVVREPVETGLFVFVLFDPFFVVPEFRRFELF